MKFDDLNIEEKILQGLDDIGYEEPTPIQINAIPLIMEGKDVIGQSQTGTGKTAAFSIPAISRINPVNKNTQILVLCPTRELALQACDEVKKFAKYLDGVKCVAIYGGQSIDRQVKLLRQGAHMIIGTPGRILDHISRKTLKLGKLKMLVLDEADEMLNMGFRDDIEEIITYVPEKRQTVLFSATMPRPIMQIVNKYLNDPVTIKTGPKQLTVPKITQSYYDVPSGKKLDTLCTLIEELNPKRSIVFCNTKRMVDQLAGELSTRGYLALGIHGDMRQIVRTNVMRSFKNGTTDILIATDVAARGIDVEDIDIVFNYDIPTDSEYYVHRIGRTGRAGKDGTAISFVCGRKEADQLRSIARDTKSRLNYKKAPSGEMVEKARLHSLLYKVEKELKNKHGKKYIELIDELTIGKYTIEDVCCALISAAVSENDESETRELMKKIEFSIGSNDGIEPKHILGSITSMCSIDGENIGKIQIEQSRSTVEVQKAFADTVIEKMNGARIKGHVTKVKKK